MAIHELATRVAHQSHSDEEPEGASGRGKPGCRAEPAWEQARPGEEQHTTGKSEKPFRRLLVALEWRLSHRAFDALLVGFSRLEGLTKSCHSGRRRSQRRCPREGEWPHLDECAKVQRARRWAAERPARSGSERPRGAADRATSFAPV
jgi:hypothetical protein